MFIDICVIQNVPSSNINRDDTGSPKTALYGGVQRARVSSQAWKRAMRVMFPALLEETSLGVRTKFAIDLIAKEIASKRADLADRAEDLAVAVLCSSGIKVKASDRKGESEGSLATGYLVFIARSELGKLSDLAISWADEGVDIAKVDAQMKKAVAEVFHGKQAIDIALFGRMLADAPEYNVDASAQVAHAISVDRVIQEYDYFTAVDDCAPEDNAGAGMIGTVSFNSSTLYRYATVDLDSLFDQVEDEEAASEGAAAFVEAFVRSMPSGKQNTFANRTLPNLVAVRFRETQPFNPVGAFEQPVYPREDASVSALAAMRLAETIAETEEAFDMPACASWYVQSGMQGVSEEALQGLGVRVDMRSLLDNVRGEARRCLSMEE